MKTFSILRIVMEIICFLFAIAAVSGDLDVDSVYEFLSRRLDELLQETGIVKSQMEEMKQETGRVKSQMEAMNERISVLEDQLTGFETTTVSSNYPGAISDMAATGLEEKLTIKSKAMHKMLADEKANIRESIQNFDAMFSMFKSELKDDMSVFKRKMVDGFAQLNFSLDEVTSSFETKNEQLRSDIDQQLKDAMDNLTNKQNMTQQNVGSLSANLKALTSTVSSLSSSLSSQTSYLSSQISSVSSSLQSKLSSESSTLSSRISTLSSSLYSKISSESSYLSSRISKEEDRKVAFSARLYKMDSFYYPKEKIRFDDVKYNYASGYDSSTGIFTAPKSGTYLFAATIEATNDGDGHVYIMVDGFSKAAVLADEGYDNTGTGVAVDFLYAGNKVWVQAAESLPKQCVNHYRSQFCGVLID